MMRSTLSAFSAGVIFALGLGVSGMTDPAAVLAFLDVTGAWNPNLAFVMASAVGVTAVGYKIIGGRTTPLFALRFANEFRSEIDASLIVGSILFGVGWGMVGYCPGPALVALSFGGRMTWVFVGSMLLGMLLYRIQRRSKRLDSRLRGNDV